MQKSAAKPKPARAPVSTRALFQRVGRALKRKGEILRTARAPAINYVGEYYTIDERSGIIRHKDIDLEDVGRELGVLHAFEEVKGES